MQDHVDVLLRGKKFKQLIDRSFEEIREKFGLKQIEIEALFYLGQHPEGSASEMCRTMNLNKGMVSQALDALCKKGYLRSWENPNNRRYICYGRTEACQAFDEEMKNRRRVLMEQLFTGITPEEFAVLRTVSEKINGNIEAMLAQ